MTYHKKPGVTFWATVVLVVVLAYPLSMGPANWMAGKVGSPAWMLATLDVVYAPVIWIARHSTVCMKAVNWWMSWWVRA
jgi:hypothetical protein